MKLFTKQPAVLAATVLGLTLAAGGYANAATSTTATTPAKPAVQKAKAGNQAKADKRQDGRMGKYDRIHKKDGMMGRQLANLQLTDTQKTQVQQLRTQQQAKMQELQATLKKYDDNITAQKKAGASTATLLGLYKQKHAAIEQAMTLRKQQQQQFLNILTPEQQLKLFESRDMMKGHHQRGDMPGMPHQNAGKK